MQEFMVRPAVAPDASSIAEIYNPCVRSSTATFDTRERSLDDQEKWLDVLMMELVLEPSEGDPAP